MIYFSPMAILILLAWLFSGLYALGLVRQYAHILPERLIPWCNLLTLFAGPATLAAVMLYRVWLQIQEAVNGAAIRKEKELENAIQLVDAQGASVFAGDSANAASSEAVGTVKRLIGQAVERHVSDIFIDPKPNNIYSVRFRIDGSLREVMTLTGTLAISAISAIKVAANMDISEHRRPQDGAFSAQTPSCVASFRVASVGAFGGEKMTIRVLGATSGLKTLKDIGLSPENLRIMENAVRMPSGLILMCGPTGSGKTSTLYALLQSIDYSLKNVISIEDPIENVMSSVSQMEVNTRAGITFSSLLRNALRQNPDIICLGEIRDEETAEVAVHAAQTGHLIIATVHSNDNLGTVDRLQSLGVPLRTIAATLHVVVSQRLVRTLCPHCKQPMTLTPEYRDYFKAANLPEDHVCRATGCRECDGTGYSGRHALFDIMVIDSALKAMLETEGATLSGIQSYIEEQHGASVMAYEGFRLVSEGRTTVEEVERVTLSLD